LLDRRLFGELSFSPYFLNVLGGIVFSSTRILACTASSADQIKPLEDSPRLRYLQVATAY
jgi:hypothetical protein